MTFNSKFSTRDQSASNEATFSPIFLFQRRKWIYTGVPEGYDYVFDYGVVKVGDDDLPIMNDDNDFVEVLTNEQLAEMIQGDWDVPCAIETWETDKVFLTRQEAETYGKNRSYNYREGWRVYSVNCYGELAEALKDGSERKGKV